MKKITFSLIGIFCFAALFAQSGGPVPDEIFTGSMVLPAETTFNITGSAPVGETVEFSWVKSDGEVLSSGQGKADGQGRWKVAAGPVDVQREATRIRLSSAGGETLLENILAGDLYLAAGQSNMEFSVSADREKLKLMRLRKTGQVRLFRVESRWRPDSGAKNPSQILRREMDTPWLINGWSDVSGSGGKGDISRFSAVAWSAAANISVKSARPVGIMQLAVGGAPLESFLPASTGESAAHRKNWLDDTSYPAWCRSRAKQNWSALLESGHKAGELFHYYAPGALYDQMKQLLQLPVRGLFWYQGESNAPEASFPWYKGGYDLDHLEMKQRRLLSIFREESGRDFPFFIIQLPSMGRNWPRFREMQARTAVESGDELIVTLDTGDLHDVHPRYKRKIGERIAVAALRRNYNMTDQTFPEMISHEIKDNSITIRFDRELAVSRGKSPRGFEICGEDLKFVRADVVLAGSEVRLSHPEVNRPLYVRFGWSGFARTNLFAAESMLPVGPFRTDSIKPVRVACAGDSITFGLGIRNRARNSYPARLQKALGAGYLVGNFGNSGSCVNRESLRNGEPRGYHFTPDYLNALAFDPDILILNLGINDIMDWHQFGKERFVADYLTLLEGWKAKNPELELWIWSPLTPLAPGQTFYTDPGVAEINEALLEVARLSGASVIDMATPFQGKEERFPDLLHPDSEGAAIIAKTVENTVFNNK